MQLIQVVKYLEQIAISSPYIRSTGEGSVYTIMNGNPHSKYGVFVISQNQHYRDEYFDHFNFNLFVIDRLIDDLDSNRLQVQSIAKECLTNILLTFKEKFYGVTYNTIRFNVFTEKFVDLCAGAYAQVEIIIPANLICSDDYGIEFDKDYTLKPLVVEITENGVYEYEPDNFDGYDKVTVTVNVDIPDNFESGFTSGVTYQKSLLSAITITENGEYITDENGVSAITVDVSGYTQDDLDDAYQSGITYQKSLLSGITIDHNGEFINVNGYSAITVNVPSTGESVNNQSKIVEISGNGSYTITYDEGYTGLEVVIINVNVSGDTPTPPSPSGDTSAYTNMYFTIQALENGTMYVYDAFNLTCYYSINNGDWTFYRNYTQNSGITISVSTGDLIRFKDVVGDYGAAIFPHFKCSFNYIVFGNIMSLINGDTFSGLTSAGNQTAERMFEDEENLISAEYLILPATEIVNSMYESMFRNCVNLKKSPKLLPATILAQQCYDGMFYNCTSLTTAPVLPATTLAYECYWGMFGKCNSLITAPVLPATTLVDRCYYYMFYECSRLNYVKCLATDISATECTKSWLFVYGDSGRNGTFVKKTGVTWPIGSSGIPDNWDVIEEN